MTKKPRDPDTQLTLLTVEKYTITEAALALGLSTHYIRSLLRRGIVKSTLEPIAKDSAVTRHSILKAELVSFLVHGTRKPKRRDGRNKYVLYASADEIIRIRETLKTMGLPHVEESLKTANPLKPRLK